MVGIPRVVHRVYNSGIPRVYNRWYTQGVYWAMLPRVYTGLCYPGCILPYTTLYYPGYTHHTPPCTGVPGHSVHHAQCPGEGVLGSKEEKPMGREPGEPLGTLKV